MSSTTATISRGSHVGRILVIARHTFTQLVRMKVFYFLGVFAVIAIGSNFFDLPQHNGPESVGISVLNSIKSWSLGTMTLFSVVLSIVATALLLPKDVEDRTLYTILAKPVPRLDYLAGKLLGVLLLVFVSLALMDGLMTLVLQIRTSMVVEQQLAIGKSMGWSPQMLDTLRAEALTNGPTWSLQGAVFAVIAIASNFFDLPQHAGPESAGINVLRSIKSWSLGTMTLFSVVLSIVATALLRSEEHTSELQSQ